ncbi:hypothetical protein H2198_004871 [Neophaeococcomyces mojaviensis]|uniref:Uncharacterized protein n=1 Tax=Neophaeococcomyces mojaviensis TaxID=3383035 RepID=A0ACC3A7Q1_9EURO|nr:hypothetical protein H2198_004871 [Knufia sp. JES_112]
MAGSRQSSHNTFSTSGIAPSQPAQSQAGVTVPTAGRSQTQPATATETASQAASVTVTPSATNLPAVPATPAGPALQQGQSAQSPASAPTVSAAQTPTQPLPQTTIQPLNIQSIRPKPNVAPPSTRLKHGLRRFISRWNDWWILEVAAGILSIVCLITIVIILGHFDGASLSKWHSWITPNAMVSVLATVSKSSVLLPVAECISQLTWLQFQRPHSLQLIQEIDEASRGALGSFNNETFIKIQWPWITLPVIVVLSANILLAIMIVQSRRKRAPIWKSSVLALLFHGLQPSRINTGNEPMSFLSELELLAEQKKVRLVGANAQDLRFTPS